MCWEPTIVYPCGCPKKDPINHEILRCDKTKASQTTCTGNELKKLYRDYAPESWTPLTPCGGDGDCPNRPAPFLKKYTEVIYNPLELAYWKEQIEKHLTMIMESSHRNRGLHVERVYLARCPEHQAMLQKLKTTWVISSEERKAGEAQADESQEDESREYESPANRMRRLDNLVTTYRPFGPDSPKWEEEEEEEEEEEDDDFDDDDFDDDDDPSLLELPMLPDPEDVPKRSRSQKIFDRIKDTLSHFKERQPAKKNTFATQVLADTTVRRLRQMDEQLPVGELQTEGAQQPAIALPSIFDDENDPASDEFKNYIASIGNYPNTDDSC